MSDIRKRNLKDELSLIPLFYCRGTWDKESMNPIDRNLCSLLKKMVAKKDPKDYEVWEEALMSTGDEKSDWCDKKYLEPILRMINGQD